MKYLAIDYGQKRVGLAISSRDEKVVVPYKTLFKSSKNKLLQELIEIIDSEQIEGIVVGLPLGLNGEDTLSTRQVRNFVKELKKMVNVPVYLIDESYTSFDAEQKLKKRGLSNKKIKNIIDQIAAMEILNTYIMSK